MSNLKCGEWVFLIVSLICFCETKLLLSIQMKTSNCRRGENPKPLCHAIGVVSLIAATKVYSSFNNTLSIWNKYLSKFFKSEWSQVSIFFVCHRRGIKLWLHFSRRVTALLLQLHIFCVVNCISRSSAANLFRTKRAVVRFCVVDRVLFSKI